MFLHPDSLICTQLKSCTVINFWLRDSLYRDRCAIAFDPNFCTVTQKWSQPTCTATAPERNKICTRTAKTRAIPSLHRDNFLAKVPGPARCSRRVTQPPHIAGPLCLSHLAPATMTNSSGQWPNHNGLFNNFKIKFKL